MATRRRPATETEMLGTLDMLVLRLALGPAHEHTIAISASCCGRSTGWLRVVPAGILLGIIASRVLGAIVYQATPRDPVVLAGVVVAMLLLGLFATWIPARRALTLDPLTLLREE